MSAIRRRSQQNVGKIFRNVGLKHHHIHNFSRMKIKQKNAGFITNYEVFAQVNTRKGTNEMGNDVKLFKSQVLQYLSTTPAAAQTTEGVKECLKYLDKYKLTRAEKLQVVNLYPTSPVDVHLIVEECPERLTEEQIEAFISDVAGILYRIPSDEADGAQQSEEQENQNFSENAQTDTFDDAAEAMRDGLS